MAKNPSTQRRKDAEIEDMKKDLTKALVELRWYTQKHCERTYRTASNVGLEQCVCTACERSRELLQKYDFLMQEEA